MILVNTNIFVDLWTSDSRWGDWSAEALARAAEDSAIAINPIIYVELCMGFAREQDLERALGGAAVRRLALPYKAAWLAASAFAAYRKSGGKRSSPPGSIFSV